MSKVLGEKVMQNMIEKPEKVPNLPNDLSLIGFDHPVQRLIVFPAKKNWNCFFRVGEGPFSPGKYSYV
jgi:hypothetical protein